MAIRFTGAHVPNEVLLAGTRWYVAYPLRTRTRLVWVSGRLDKTSIRVKGEGSISPCGGQDRPDD